MHQDAVESQAGDWKDPLEPMNSCGDMVFAETGDDSDVMWCNMLPTGLEEIPALPKPFARSTAMALRGAEAPREAMVLRATSQVRCR